MMDEQPVHIVPHDSPRFDSSDPALVEFLKEFGYVVVKGVASFEEVNEAKELLWQFLEENSPMRQNNPSTWGDEAFQQVGLVPNGILCYKGIGQSKFLWRIRLLSKLKEAFGLIYDTEDLITSFDGGNVFRPWQALPEYFREGEEMWKTSSGWFHVDQGRDLRGLQCVQGLVTLTDVTPATGGFCVIPKSHLYHDSLVDEAAVGPRNFVIVPPSNAVLSKQQLLPVVKAGDLILWDSRTIHCSTPALVHPTAPENELLRVAAYVAMVPRSFATDDIVTIREALFAANQTTSHWPHIFPHSYEPQSSAVVNDINHIPHSQRALISGTRL